MTEDEEFKLLELKEQMIKERNLKSEAQIRAMQFIEDNTVIELGIMTLRKAYETGYLSGVYDEQRKRNGN
jgi:hypothetical protein